jgi:hypothetical protein
MSKFTNLLSTPLHLDTMQGASEERIELYCHTVIEYRSWQRRSVPRAVGAASCAGRQGSGAEVWHATMAKPC